MTRVLDGWPHMLPVQGFVPSRSEPWAWPESPDRGLLAARRPSVQVILPGGSTSHGAEPGALHRGLLMVHVGLSTANSHLGA